MNTQDTIIAPATAPGEGGIAIIRISGPGALSSLKFFFQPSGKNISYESHRLYHGILNDENGEAVDEVMAVYMAAPRTYTCDDVVEIHCHGSQQIVKTILDLYQKTGIRLASPGEFTYRAFVNGRIDLSQAEAVARLIASNSDAARKLALSQVDGELSRFIFSITDVIKRILVLAEAWIDFPEEDLPDEDVNHMTSSVQDLLIKINEITSHYDYGRIQVEGACITLVGEPNAGKSSLLNALLGEDRAIVTHIPGTTRDLIEEGLFIDGMPVRLIDTAGLRATSDLVEQEGIRRAENKMDHSDLVLLLFDGSVQQPFDHSLIDKCLSYPTFLLVTKHDLAQPQIDSSLYPFPVFHVSAKTGYGITDLKKDIKNFLLHDPGQSVMLTERRHYEALIASKQNLLNFINLIQLSESMDLLAFELREALYHLGQISGETTTEDILDDIFSGFCIGK